MKNRSSYAVLTRFGIIAAMLATLGVHRPAVFADALEFDYPENGTDPVLTFSATDADGDDDRVEFGPHGRRRKWRLFDY